MSNVKLIKKVEADDVELNDKIQAALYELYIEYLDTVAEYPLRKGRFSLRYGNKFLNFKNICVVGAEYEKYVMHHDFDPKNENVNITINYIKFLLKGNK